VRIASLKTLLIFDDSASGQVVRSVRLKSGAWNLQTITRPQRAEIFALPIGL
jgi:hypothetical protein